MTRYIILYLFLLFSFNSKSQIIKVVNSKNNQAIENVYIFDSKNSCLSDFDGMADISSFHDDILIFQHPSFQNITLNLKQLAQINYIVKLKPDIFSIKEIIVSASKWEQNKNEIPLKVLSIHHEEIQNSTAQTSADLLKVSNQVYIQKSQLGGGSPMIRGFSANRVLLVLDGVRLNNAIYRSGNLQNVLNIDPNSLAQTEIILGPGSIIYGSDAIGGVIDFHTLQPKYATSKKKKFHFSYKSRYSSANKEVMNHAQYHLQSQKIAWIGSMTYSDFSDLKMGKHGSNDYLRTEYVSRKNGEDIIIQNSDPEIQKKSAYSQFNILQKLRYKASESTDLLYNFQYSETSNIPRYDRLIQYKDGHLKYGDWYYGPQKLQFHSFTLSHKQSSSFFDSFKVVTAYQNYKESRHSRNFGSYSLKNRIENLDIYSINADAEKQINSKFHFFYGGEWTLNLLSSKGKKENLKTKECEKISSRYPDDSNYSSLAFYTNLKWKLNQKWTLNSGIRYSHFWLDSSLDPEFYDYPFSKLDLSTGSLNGGIGITLKTDNQWVVKVNTTTGFRAPNIDDVAKIFDSEPGKVVVPNKNLKSEYIYNFELNLNKKFANQLLIDINAFYSYLDNAMVRKNYTFNGKSTIIYDDVESQVQAIVNADHAQVWGGNVSVTLKITEQFSAFSSINYTKGEYKDGSAVRHVPPLFCTSYLKYKNNKFTSKLEFEFNKKISFNNLATSEKDKPHLYAKDRNGKPYSPSWTVFNLKNQFHLSKKWNLNFSVENIFNKRYRPYSSGINAAGRNFIIGMRYSL